LEVSTDRTQRRVHTSRNDCAVVVGYHLAARRVGSRCSPKMVRRIGEKTRRCFAEERRPAAVLLSSDDLIEEDNRWVSSGLHFAIIDENVEC
jgi:hypothetical protein